VTLGDISVKDAMEGATEPHDLLLALQQAGVVDVGAFSHE
jgi:hypothetical protein